MNNLSRFSLLKLYLFLIVLTAIVLRFYAINSVPVSLYWDEVATAYNAYSIAQTGKDEYGTFLPLLFRSFDDYKMPGNIYLTAIFVTVFGLNEFSVRVSSAVAGVFTVLLTYFLVKQLLLLEHAKHKKIQFTNTQQDAFALLSAGLLAISPWHIQFSRTGFEANIALFFVVLGTYLFLKGIKNSFYLYSSFFIFSLSFYFYRSIQVFLPLFILSLCIIFRNELFIEKRKQIIVSLIIFILTLAPLVPWIFSTDGMSRAKQVTITQDVQKKLLEYNQHIDKYGNTFINKLIYNRRIILVEDVVGNYFSHFTPQFLFLGGDANGRHHVVGMGLFYVWELPFLLLGVYASVFLPRKIRFILLSWILLAPLPASLSIPAPHALRSLNMLPVPQIFIALGLLWAYIKLVSQWRFVFILCLLFISTFSFTRYLYLYYIVTPRQTASEWADGYKQLTQYIIPKENRYEKIIVSGHYWQPYIYFLFHKQYDPTLFQKTGSSITFGKYYFGGTGWDRDKGRDELDRVNLYEISKGKDTLVALSPEEYREQKNNLKNVQQIVDSYGKNVFMIGELK